MFDQEFYIAKLIGVYLQETITEEELAHLEAWIAESPQNKSHFDQAYQQHVLAQKLKAYQNVDGASVWSKTISRIEREEGGFYKQRRTRIVQLRRWTIAAAVATVVFGASLYFYKQSIPEVQVSADYAQDVAPGKQGATLTLANGQQIRLSDAMNGTIAEEVGVSVTKSADGQLIYELKGGGQHPNQENTLSTANGETYRVRLPDGSTVWLNAGSSLTYSPKLINNRVRLVKLAGEAYFEIAKDKKHPFIVKTKDQEVEVLGTHFNVNAYANESLTATTLVEGSVKVRHGVHERKIFPGQQVLNDGRKLRIGNADLESVIDWKEGDFFLNHVNFKSAMRKIARWYDVEIVYDAAIPNDMEAGGWISRDKPLSQVLKSIESSGMVKFKIDGRKIYVFN